MWKVARCRVSYVLFVLLGGMASLLVLPPAPCRADVAPESALLVHVQSVSGSCWAPITDCHQINRSTEQEGPVEFILYFMRGAYWAGPVCLRSLQTTLAWPDTWQLLELWQCPYGNRPSDSSRDTHVLDLSWDDFDYVVGDGNIIPVARLIMNVVGPGRLDFTSAYGSAVIGLNCGLPTVTYPIQIYAEAGIQCGHISAHCGYDEWACEPLFNVPELLLSAASGEATDSTVQFRMYSFWQNCSPVVDTQATWCTASAEYAEYDSWNLHVTADAVALPPGTYSTAIELSIASWGVARCLPVVFTVHESTATSSMSWGRIKGLFR